MNPTLNCADLLEEVRSIRDQPNVTKIIQFLNQDQHDSDTIFLRVPLDITENITKDNPSGILTLTDLADKFFAQRAIGFTEIEQEFADIETVSHDPSKQSEHWAATIKEVSVETQKKSAEFKLTCEAIEAAYLRVAERAGCGEQLKMLFKVAHEAEKRNTQLYDPLLGNRHQTPHQKRQNPRQNYCAI